MKIRIAALGARPEFWLGCLLLWLLLSACRSLGTPWARVALTEALRWGAGIGLMLALGRTLRQTRPAARLVTVLAGLMALAGVWDGFHPEQGGVVGPYHDHQLYGSALLILLPFPVALALTARATAWRWGATAVGAACLVCLALSQTRSAWAGLLAAALVFTGLWCYGAGVRRRQGRLILTSATVLLGAVGLLCLFLGPPDLRDALTQRAGTLSSLDTDESWQGRLTAWHGATRMAGAQPIYGIGLGRYPGTQHLWTGAGRVLEPTARPSLSEEAHSFYLQTIVETGSVGLVLYLAALVAFSIQALRRLRQARGHLGSRESLIIAVLSLMAGQAVDAVASPSWQFAETSLFFWALLGLGLAAIRREQPEPSAASLRPPLRHALRLAVAGATAVVLAANILPFGLLSPVEAYSNTAPDGYVFDTTASTPGEISPTSPTLPASGGTIAFRLYAHYVNPNKNTDKRNEDVTFDGPTAAPPNTYFTVVGNHTLHATGFSNTPATRNVLTVDAQDTGFTLTVSGNFYVGGVHKLVQIIFVPHSGS